MNTAAALLAAIREQPDDDLPRLAYADWCEENGDAARARLIRVQCAMAKTDLFEPEYQQLRREDQELRLAHEMRWRHEVPYIGPVAVHLLRRGFFEGAMAESYAAFRRDAGRIREAISLRWLGLMLRRRLRHFKGPSCLEGLDSLMLFGGFADGCVAALAALPPLRSLKQLWLHGQPIGPADVAALAGSPHLAGLEGLVLGHNPFLGLDGVTALLGSPYLRLRRLEMPHVNMPDGAAVALFASPVATHLKRLVIGSNRLTDPPLLALARDGPRGLEELTLDHERFSLPALQELLASPAVGRLRMLSLSGNRLGDGLAEAVAQAPGLRQLRNLTLVGCDIGSAGARALAESPHLVNLRALALSVNRVGDEGAAALAAAAWIRRLHPFGLSHNGVGDAGMRALARVRSAASLRRDGLASNPISDAAWEKALAEEEAR